MNNNKDKNDKEDKKDFWDISKIVVTLLFTTIGGGMVGGFTALTSYQVRVQEINLKRIETVEKFMPYLIGEINGRTILNAQAAKENTIIVIASLGNGNEDLAINLARFNPSGASITILSKIVFKLIPLKDSDDANSKANSKDTSEAKALASDAIEAIGEIGKSSDSDIVELVRNALQNIEKNYKNRSPELSKKATEASKITSPPILNQSTERQTKWAIVIGSDTNLPGATYEKQQAEELRKNTKDSLLTKGEIKIYKRKQWYATVVEGIDQDNRDKILGYWREKFRPSSFLIDFNDWCKKQPKDKEGEYSECE
ncbi:MAG: hypothetical protein EWV58_21170 [Microcystis aeruginosa Ma_MB_F_20061100_S19]|nr:hypothetical protein [Microcystis aeruginosa L311-01]OCY15567.1 MAG: hypothetical protein BEV12_14425 [Microcystis aeruginosa CACIAM 03]TRU08839.1 MAG: hypothetical protein EWV59_15205 [Microcystis aeruginosa Ma_MB_F_20061100_S19D]TRU09855.1 MAG: hypothetical protein EWV58_21170 [Microcystis aeruginosa Ma_MB_F_20061100_S19]